MESSSPVIHHSSFITHHSLNRPPDPQHFSLLRVQLHHHRLPQPGMRDAIAENNPPVRVAGKSDVNDFIGPKARAVDPAQSGESVPSGPDVEDASLTAGRILHTEKSQKEDAAEKNPRDVDCGKDFTTGHVRIIA